MKKLFQLAVKALKVDMIKVFSFTAMSTLVKMLTGLISIKFVATMIGPSGIALLGQLNSFSTIIMIIASGGINNGVTKYVAEYKESAETVKSLLSTALRITIACSFVSGLIMIVFHEFLSNTIMLSPDFGYIFVIFGSTVFLYALNSLIASVLNGYKEYKRYVYVNIVGSFLGLVFTLVLVLTMGLKGALISAVTFQSIMFFVSLWMVKKLPWLNFIYFRKRIDGEIIKKYLKYALMTFVTAATGPVSQLILRGHVIVDISSQHAGWWEAMNRISNMYLLIITSSFGVYYLPRLSEISDRRELRNEIFKSYKIIVPALIAGFTIIYFSRFLIIKVLFTRNFLMMEDLFLWQLIGDFFKICSWLLAFLMVAKAMTKTFIATEILFTAGFVALSFVFIKMNGIIGITQASAITYFLYLVCMVIVFRKLIFNNNES